MSCPFYGCKLVGPRGNFAALLMPTRVNICALITSADTPCKMEIQGAPPDWAETPRNPENNGTGYDAIVTQTMTREEVRRRFPYPFDAQESEP